MLELLLRQMDLSDDVWNVIFSYLDVKGRTNIASVNRRLSKQYWNGILELSGYRNLV